MWNCVCTVCSGIWGESAYVRVPDWSEFCRFCGVGKEGGYWIQINFMEVSKVNLEEQIAAWVLFEGVFSGF